MLNRIRSQIGNAGLVVAVVALIVGLTGGAMAAGGGNPLAGISAKKKQSGLTAKQKREVRKIAKSFQGSGPTGPQGPAGAGGPKGDSGANGQDGAQGPQGLQGAAGTNGTNGTNGTDGKSVLNGTGAPSSGLGTEGDFYIDTGASEIYGPKTGAGWGSGTSLIGPGAVTEVNTGFGLSGGPITLTGTLEIDPTQTQKRVFANCPVGEAMVFISETGGVACEEVGRVREILVSDGLTGGGDTSVVGIGVDSSQIQSRVTGECPSGEAIQKIDQSGTVTCTKAEP